MAGDQAVQHSVRRQPAHVDQPIDSLPVAVELKIALPVHGQSGNAEIDTLREPPVEADLFRQLRRRASDVLKSRYSVRTGFFSFQAYFSVRKTHDM